MRVAVALSLASVVAATSSASAPPGPTFQKLPEYKPETQQVWDPPAVPDDDFLQSLTAGVEVGLQALHVLPGLIESFGGLDNLQKKGLQAMAETKPPEDGAPRGDRARDGRCRCRTTTRN